MIAPQWKIIAVVAAIGTLGACSTGQQGEAADGVSAGTATSSGGAAGTGSGSSVPGLVNVNLENVLNNLSVALKVDRANIPVNAQVPIDVAANVCGVSVNVLSVSTGGQASCTATTASPQLVQVVQQQVAAGGNVGGGDQTTGNTTTNNSM